MNRRFFFILPLAAVAACRSVIGIEEVTLEGDDTSGDAASEAAADATTTGADASTRRDAGTDSSATTPDAALANACSNSPREACIQCCRTAAGNTANVRLNDRMKEVCICGGRACSSDCAQSTCGNVVGPPIPACGECMDREVKSTACACALEKCKDDSACSPLGNCVEACP